MGVRKCCHLVADAWNNSIKAGAFRPIWGFPCGSAGKESTCNARDLGSIPGLGRSPGEGNGYPLQYSGLENIHGVTKSGTRLSNFHFHFTFSLIGLVVFPTFFSLSLNLVIRSHSQLPVLFLLTLWSFSIFAANNIINLISVLTI